MSPKLKALNEKIERMNRTLEAQEILIRIGKDLKEPYSFRDIDRLISERIKAHSQS